MRVCLVNPTVLVRRPVSELASKLREQGFSVGLVSPAGSSGLHHEKYLEGVEVFSYRSWQPIRGFEWPVPWGFSSLIKRLRGDFDVFHAWTYFYLSSVLLAVVKPSKLVVTLDTVPGESFSLGWFLDSLFWLYNRSLGRWVLSRADKVSVYSESLVGCLRDIGFSGSVAVTPTGIIEPSVEESVDLPADYVAFVGLLSERKGFDRVLAVAKRLPELEFLVAGDSPSRARWEALAPANVTFLGKIDYVPALMSSARCLLLPSRGEGLPGVVMEAMALRCPVVASDVLCIPDLVRDGKDGVLVSGDDVEGFVDAIKQLGDEKVAKKYSSSAYTRVQEKFLWSVVVDDFVQLYGVNS